jgi:NAD(P)-dependent dehydrogenase (short-subunit alcohol dehydrogenase family)
MADLSGKVALVVDGCGTLGAGICQALGEAGATVCVMQNEAPPETGLGSFCQRVVDTHGRLDLLVNDVCAALTATGPAGPFWEHGAADWQRGGAALQSCLETSAHAARVMVGQEQGLIVNLGAAGLSDVRGGLLPRVAAAAVDKMAAEMARELSHHGVVALALHAAAPLFTGRCIAALAMDPDIAEKAGGSYRVARLAEEYRFSDPEAAA